MIWYKKVLGEYSRKALVSTGLLVMVLFMMSAYQLINGNQFEWKNIAPVNEPDIFARAVYSALTFVTIGALLYFLRFYQLLSFIFGQNRRGYRDTKKLIWTLLLLLMFFVLVPAGVDVLNAVISFLYNIALFLYFVSPVALLSILVIIATLVYRKNLPKNS